MDPFVVISFGKKVFRTRVIRHSLNPVWDEKLLFHVRRYETAFQVQLTVLDWDKLSSNDHIGDASFSVKELVDSAPQPDPVTGLYNEADEDHPMSEFGLRLSPAKETQWEAKYNPVITFRYAFLCHVLILYLSHPLVPNTNHTTPCDSVSGAST
jgi:phosphatidylserine decarboxylase